MGALIRIVVGIIVAAALSTVVGLGFVIRYLDEPLPIAEPVIFEIPPGRGLNGVATDLAQRGLVTHPRVFALYGRWQSSAGRIQAGEYRLKPGQTPAGLLEQFVSGEVLLHNVTLVEGWTFAQALAAIRAHPAVNVTESVDAEASRRDWPEDLGLSTPSPEGWLLPDTYLFPRGTSDLAILRMAKESMDATLAEAWETRDPALPLETPYEALILASIVEKETGLGSERPRIAGVFVRRLQKGMRLQTDPTVIYGLGPEFDGNLRKTDLTRDTPYNSYTRHGLPPTPIALPGRDSLMAAVQPADGDALYFVATGEADGSHHFSATLEEHNQAVARYLARLRERKE